MTTKSKESDTRLINGEPYTVTRVGGVGYQVTATGSPTDRIGRSYLVQLSDVGVPIRCSCPDNFHRQVRCKHMTEVAVVLTETALAGLTEIGKTVANMARPEYWRHEDNHRAAGFAAMLPQLRWVYSRIRKGATPRPVLYRLRPVLRGIEANALERLIERC